MNTFLPYPRVNRIILASCVLYCIVFTFQYISDPLALSPQLDAQENLVLAGRINEGTLPAEPFFRAMLYPAVLSLIHPVESRPVLGLLFGLCCHLLNAFLIFRLSVKVWDKSWAGTFSSSLYLLNPASLFFALQLLDVTFAISLFLGGILLGVSGDKGRSRFLWAGLLLGLSVLARPHFLPVVLLGPAILALWPGLRWGYSSLAWIPIVGLLLLQGALNHQMSGDFRILPWQGSYNLWAANRPGANGLYFKQVVDVSGRSDNSNPAKAESIALYSAAHPDQTRPYAIDEMNHYWKDHFMDRLWSEPVSLARLMVFKAYAVANSYEQYNNLTLSYHKKRLFLLRINPLGWGVLFIAGIGGIYVLLSYDNRKALVLAFLILSYLATLLIYYASARFRLPMVPLMAILSGGILAHPFLPRRGRGNVIWMLLVIVASGILTFSSYSGVDDQDTYVQDQLLLANANADLGQDTDAAQLARSVLQSYPQRKEAQRIYTVSYFNMQLMRDSGLGSFGGWGEQKEFVIQSPPTDPVQDAVLGVYMWKWGQSGPARSIWRSVSQLEVSGSSLARSCLRLTDKTVQDPKKDTPLEHALRPILLEFSENKNPNNEF